MRVSGRVMEVRPRQPSNIELLKQVNVTGSVREVRGNYVVCVTCVVLIVVNHGVG